MRAKNERGRCGGRGHSLEDGTTEMLQSPKAGKLKIPPSTLCPVDPGALGPSDVPIFRLILDSLRPGEIIAASHAQLSYPPGAPSRRSGLQRFRNSRGA